MQPIRIFDSSINLIAEIDNYKSLQFQRKLYSAGSFTLRLNANVRYAEELKKNRIITLGNNTKKVGIIKYVSYTQDSNEVLEVVGFELKWIFNQRITIPTAGQSHISFTTDPVETMLKTLVTTNQNTAGMAFTNLDVIADSGRGATGTTKSRYQDLANELERIGRAKEMGHLIQLNFTSKKMEFDVIIPNDFTATSGSPVIFSEKYDNINYQKYVDSDIDMYNYAIVAGQGVGAARTIETAGTLLSDLDLSVTFVDAKDINDSASLISRGEERLAETTTQINFDCTISENKPFVYEVDYELGDKVTIVADKFSVTYDKIIEEITEFYDSNGRTITAVFGTPANLMKKYIEIKTDYGIE